MRMRAERGREALREMRRIVVTVFESQTAGVAVLEFELVAFAFCIQFSV